MRIGLTGAQSVGKTTLARALGKLEQFKDYFIATERSKYLRDLGIPLNTDSTLLGQFVFLAERSSELLHENLITDRTVWDVCAFTLSSKTINDFDKRSFVNTAMSIKNYYDLVIYVSTEGVEMENNQVRSTDITYRNQIDVAINVILNEFPPKKLIRIGGTTEQRISSILQNF